MNNTASQHRLDEVLSASVDGEASELELRQLLKALESGDDNYDHLRDKWASAHTAGAAMRGDDMRFANMDISSQVSTAIQDESVVTDTAKPVVWKEVWGKTGIAAAVALGVLFTFQITQDESIPSDQVTSTAPLEKTVEQADPAAPQWFQQAPITTRAASVAGTGASGNVFEAHTDVELNSDEELKLRLQHILQQHAQDAKNTPVTP